MEFLKNSLAYILSAFLGAAAWVASVNFLPQIGSYDAKVIAAIVTVVGTLVTGVVLALLNHSKSKARELEAQRKISERELEVQKQIREREIEESHRERKVEMYLDFVSMISNFMRAANSENKKKPLSKQQILDKIEKFQNGILLWGGPKVVKAYLNYRQTATADAGNQKIFESVDSLYLAIREDIGLSNKELNNLETVRLYLKDPGELDKIKDITMLSS